jgi:ATP-binding cassette subfamily B protein
VATSAQSKDERKITLRDVLRPHAKSLAFAALAAVGDATASLLNPWPLKIVLDNVLKSKPVTHGWLNHLIYSLTGGDKLAVLRFASIAVVVIAIAGALCSYAEKLLTTSTGQWVMHDLRQALYTHIQRMSLAYHDRKTPETLLAG